MPRPKDYSKFCGVVLDAPSRPAVTATIPALRFAAPQLYGSPLTGGDMLLYKAWVDVLKAFPDYPAQKIGDCTSFGSGHTLDLLTCVLIATKSQPMGYLETCTEAIYGMGREIGNMLGGGDGCYGSAVTKALVEMGAVPRKFVGEYSGERAKKWGSSGAPANVKTEAAKYKLGASAAVTSLADADAALDSGRPFIICSNQGFTMTRDSTGMCHPEGSWAHCMSCSGRRIRDGKTHYCIDQSWGSKTPSGPLADGQPPFSFWIDGSVLERMLGAGDSFAFDKFGGFVPLPIPAHWTYRGFA
jgi:hypothetical protein